MTETENQFRDKIVGGMKLLVSEQGTMKLGSMFMERYSANGGGITLFETDPRRDLDHNDPEHKRAWKDIKYIDVDAVDALILLDFLKGFEDELVSGIARRAKEARR